MTRQEFIDEINDWWDLIDFCNSEGCDYLENIYTEESRDDYINEYQLEDWVRNNTWRNLYSLLDDIPSDYEYYRIDEYGDWEGLDDYDFGDYKDDVLRWADDRGIFDEEDEEEDPADYGIEDEEVDDEEVEEPISMFELLSGCQDTYQKISEEEADEGLDSLLIPA